MPSTVAPAAAEQSEWRSSAVGSDDEAHGGAAPDSPAMRKVTGQNVRHQETNRATVQERDPPPPTCPIDVASLDLMNWNQAKDAMQLARSRLNSYAAQRMLSELDEIETRRGSVMLIEAPEARKALSGEGGNERRASRGLLHSARRMTGVVGREFIERHEGVLWVMLKQVTVGSLLQFDKGSQ